MTAPTDAAPERIRVLISSRINAPVRFGGKEAKLVDVRAALHKLIAHEELFGREPFVVWRSEKAAESASESAIARCKRRTAECDVFIAITNGEGGFVVGDTDDGICQLELQAAYEDSPAKVYLIGVPPPDKPAYTRAQLAANERFRRYIKELAIWKTDVADGDEAVVSAQAAMVDAVVRLTQGGVTAGRTGARSSTVSLNWESMDLRARANAIRKAATAYLKETTAPIKSLAAPGHDVHLEFDGTRTLCRVHAVPEALSYAPARDLVGQVFRDDHLTMPGDAKVHGPVHFIACHRGVTRGQARKLLGVDDATYIDTDFGVFMADEVQQVQVFLIKNCRDPTSSPRTSPPVWHG
ncbi:MAG: hypothetical protein JWM87_1473 [Candidatus Eremiobacteraeota bacterium]|nr:hypothetical protein [Candidatus Eremiobacteraeota bacterium]